MDPYIVDYDHKILNTDKFRQAAIFFENNGCYTFSPKGTSSYKEYWDEETKRCLYGFTADDGDKISGYFYFYLNYCQIQRIFTYLDNGVKRVIRKSHFPAFWKSDYDYFEAIELAELNGKHVAVLKARRKGYSFKGGAMMCRNFYLIPGSKSYAYASKGEFLTRDGIISKAWEMMDFIDQNTAWSKKRQKIDTKMHKRASFVVDVNGVKTELGYKSEIIGVSLNNDPNKVRGKSAKLILWEEGGNFPELLDAWQIARPSVEQGSNVLGLMIAFGTGGSDDSDFEGLNALFYEPDGYNILPVKNIWDEGASNSCGFFVPEYVNMEGEDLDGNKFVDEYGNSNISIAKTFSLLERKKTIEGSSSKIGIDRYIAEHPFSPAEAMLRLTGNIFPKSDIIKHLASIRNNEGLRNYKQVGELNFDSSGVLKWTQNPNMKDLVTYKLRKGDSSSGAIVIWEHPVTHPIPYGLYVAGIDPYDHDQSSTDSLGSCIIYKRFQNFESYYDLPVAEYTGRPDTADEYYENVRKLLIYYRATALYENERKGIYVYFSNKNSDYLLADQPNIISDIIKDSSVQRRKGIHMTQAIKDWGELKLRDWLNEEYEPGKKNLTKIMSEALLEELIHYNSKGNFDRVIALIMIMIYIQEFHKIHVKKTEKIEYLDNFFKEPIFKDVINFDKI